MSLIKYWRSCYWSKDREDAQKALKKEGREMLCSKQGQSHRWGSYHFGDNPELVHLILNTWRAWCHRQVSMPTFEELGFSPWACLLLLTPCAEAVHYLERQVKAALAAKRDPSVSSFLLQPCWVAPSETRVWCRMEASELQLLPKVSVDDLDLGKNGIIQQTTSGCAEFKPLREDEETERIFILTGRQRIISCSFRQP